METEKEIEVEIITEELERNEGKGDANESSVSRRRESRLWGGPFKTEKSMGKLQFFEPASKDQWENRCKTTCVSSKRVYCKVVIEPSWTIYR